MPDPPPPPDRDTAPEAEERLMDALLREHARLGAADDEALLANVERAIEAPVPATANYAPPRERESVWWKVAAVAAWIVALGAGGVVWTAHRDRQDVARALEEAESQRADLESEAEAMQQRIAESRMLIDKEEEMRQLAEKRFAMLNAELAELRTANDEAKKKLAVAEMTMKEVTRVQEAMEDSVKLFDISSFAVQGFGGGGSGHARISGGTDAPAPRRRWGLPPGNFEESRMPRTGSRAEHFREHYGQLVDNRFASPLEAPLSTFSIDVDTASYANIRRKIREGRPIPKDAVRIEEMINYFDYAYPVPQGAHPLAVDVETASCPWREEHRLVRIALKGREIEREKRPFANLVFLIDVSGSMRSPDKLDLLRDSMKLLVEELDEGDWVTIVVYASSEGLVLPPTQGHESAKIVGALDRLHAGGSTNGGAGIELAYRMAQEKFIGDGVNRVILCTDGDFNVGTTVQGDLVDLVEARSKNGVFLSVLGFGAGNLNDSMLEAITNKGDGTYYYIDALPEGRKVLTEDLMATLVTIAKDVKVQVEFNPAKVASYRLIGYANRLLRPEDFRNDKIDAGDMGAGHRVTALYEIIPAGAEREAPVPALKYQKPKTEIIPNQEVLTVKVRYKKPQENVSVPFEIPVTDPNRSWETASDDFQFAASVAAFGMILRDSKLRGDAILESVTSLAERGNRRPNVPRRKEFIDLLKQFKLRIQR